MGIFGKIFNAGDGNMVQRKFKDIGSSSRNCPNARKFVSEVGMSKVGPALIAVSLFAIGFIGLADFFGGNNQDRRDNKGPRRDDRRGR